MISHTSYFLDHQFNLLDREAHLLVLICDITVDTEDILPMISFKHQQMKTNSRILDTTCAISDLVQEREQAHIALSTFLS